MRWKYIAAQGLRLLFGSRLQTVLLVLCYTGGIIIPMTILSYREGVIDGLYNNEVIYDYTFHISTISEEVFQKLTDYGEINDLMNTIGGGAKISIHMNGYNETAIMLGEHLIKGRAGWSLADDGLGNIFNLAYEMHPDIIGKPLSPDAPYDIMIGDKMLRGKGKLESFVGKQVEVYGQTYTICGILRDVDSLQGNVLSRPGIIGFTIHFQVPDQSKETYKRIDNEFFKRYGITGGKPVSTEPDLYYIDIINKSMNHMFAVALFGFAFCIINCFGIATSFLYDIKKKVYIKLSMGASRRDIFIELMVFWVVIGLTGSLLAFASFFGAKAYMDSIFFYKLLLGWRVAVLLPVSGLVTAAAASLYSVIKIARKLA